MYFIRYQANYQIQNLKSSGEISSGENLLVEGEIFWCSGGKSPPLPLLWIHHHLTSLVVFLSGRNFKILFFPLLLNWFLLNVAHEFIVDDSKCYIHEFLGYSSTEEGSRNKKKLLMFLIKTTYLTNQDSSIFMQF